MRMTIMEPKAPLPAELTSFVGRRQELDDIRRMLAANRLLTLIGVGGVGKTRLALRTAAAVERSFRDGVGFVELAALRDAHLLPHTVASALGLGPTSDSPLGKLAEHLEDKHLLLVLDNCEHLIEACALLVTRLMAAAPGLHILATSRHVLGVDGEGILPVPPLSTPTDPGAPAGDALRSEAVTLLVDRATAVDPGFELTDANRDAVSELCRRLDGLPLALELVAVWLRALSPSQILDRLEDRFELLGTGQRGRDDRQNTLEAAVAWSFELCSSEEQLLWTRLSVFAGGFDLEACEEICAGDGLARDDVLLVLAGLVDKSVVVREPDVERGSSWYRLLETIRQYGARRLAPAEARQLCLRHREHYRRLASSFAAEYFTPHQAEWHVRMAREHANVRAALDFCLERSDEAAAALDIAAPLWSWWHAGHLHEGYRYLLRGLELATEPTRSRGYGLFATSNLAIHLSDFDRALALLDESGQLAARFGDELLSARVKQCQGHALLHSGQPAEAVPLLEAARDEARRLGQARDEFRDVNLLSIALMFLGDPRAEEVGQQALRLAEDHEADASRGWALWGLGLAQWRAGKFDEATRSQREGIELFRPMHNNNGLSVCIEALAWCAASARPDARAARLLGAAEAVWRTIGGNAFQEVYRQFDRESADLVRSAIGAERFEAAYAVGAAYSVDQAVSLAVQEPARRGSAAAAARAGQPPGGLTLREWEVAQLLAEGLSNKQVAERLVISTRTAETHVEHILVKLGFRTRTQATHWVLDQRAAGSAPS